MITITDNGTPDRFKVKGDPNNPDTYEYDDIENTVMVQADSSSEVQH